MKGDTESVTAVLIWKLTELIVDAIAALLSADARLLVRKTPVIREGKGKVIPLQTRCGPEGG
jgi:hypothetical protein